jgi:hypothetical protein
MKVGNKRKDSLDCTKYPKTVQEHIDYDYTGKLSETDKEYLARFTAEYYTADFEINDTFVQNNQTTRDNLKPELAEWLSSFRENAMVRINDKDMRSFRSVNKFYRDGLGGYDSNPRSKYVNSIHDRKGRSECNVSKDVSQRDIYSKGRVAGVDWEGRLDEKHCYDSPEDYFLDSDD